MNQPNFFENDSPFLHHPLLTEERTRKEVDFLLSHLPLAAKTTVLDVGCGFGRHSVELAKRGFRVTGIDPAEAMITAAKIRAAETAVPIQFSQTPAETFVTDEPFAAAICLFTTLGQHSAAGENSGLVSRVYDALKSGGYFVVEAPQRETAVRQLKPTDTFGQGERYTAVTRQYHADEQTITETFTQVAPEGNREFLLRYRLYSCEELTDLMVNAGFTIVGIFGDYDGTPLAAASATMIVIGQR